MFGQNNNNDRSINTRIKTFFSNLSCMQMSYWNDNLSLRISPCSGTNPDGIRQYNYNQKISTAISGEKCLALYNKIKETIIPALDVYKKDKTFEKPINVGVQVNNKGSAVFIELKKDEKDIPYVFLTMYTNIGQDNKAPKEGVYSYRFNKTIIVTDYDPENGTGTDEYIDAEFAFFCEKLKTMPDINGTAAHSVNTNAAYKTQSPSSGGFQNSQQQQNTSQNNYSAPVSSFDSEDFPF